MPVNDAALLRGLFAHASVGMALVGTDGRWVSANAAMCRLVGYEERELRGQHFQAITHVDDRYKDASFVEKLLAGETDGYRVEKRYVHKDGHVAWVEVSASRVRSESRDLYLFVSQDIGSRKEMELALHRSEESFRVLIEGAPDSICVHASGVVRYVNPAFATLLGRARPDELVGILLSELLPASERLRVGPMFGAKGRDPRRTFDAHFLRKDGHHVFCEISELPVTRGHEPSSVMFVRDLSAREASFRKLLRADRLAAMGTLASGIAHEINNPLALVVANLELALETVTSPKHAMSKEELAEILTEAREGAMRVSGVVRNMRQLGTIESDANAPAQLVDVSMAMDSVLRLMWNQLKHRAILTKDVQPGSMVRARADELEQLFLNLLLYAGRPALGDASLVSIVVRVRAEGDRVIIEVEDSHPPLSDEQREHVFDPFYSSGTGADGASVGAAEGGLGLAVSHGIVAQLQGEITAGRSGAANVFRVSLPAVVAPSVASPPASTVASPAAIAVSPPRALTSVSNRPPPSSSRPVRANASRAAASPLKARGSAKKKR